jgi:hypothetical protein
VPLSFSFSFWFAGALLLLLGALLGGGCNTTSRDTGQSVNSSGLPDNERVEKHPNVPISNTDECAEQLHEICGALLQYYRANLDLPPRLDALREVPGFDQLKLNCPVTNRPYVYNPIGIQNAQNKQRIIVYDPAPVHSGMRWAIVIDEPKPDRALVTKVIALAESNFSLQIR